MAQATLPPDAESGRIPDDYHIDRDYERPSPPIGLQIVRVLRVILVIVMALTSVALCWLIGTVIGLW